MWQQITRIYLIDFTNTISFHLHNILMRYIYIQSQGKLNKYQALTFNFENPALMRQKYNIYILYAILQFVFSFLFLICQYISWGFFLVSTQSSTSFFVIIYYSFEGMFHNLYSHSLAYRLWLLFIFLNYHRLLYNEYIYTYISVHICEYNCGIENLEVKVQVQSECEFYFVIDFYP